MGSITLVVNKDNSNLLKILNTFDFKELDKKYWLEMGNGVQAKTYICRINIKFFSKKEDISVLIVEGEKDDMPLIGMEFLKKNKKHLSLDFMKKVFKLI